MKLFSYVFAFLLLVAVCNLWTVTRTVDISGSGQYTSIQTAINACAQGDTVLVYPGRYYENVYIHLNDISLFSLEALTNDESYIGTTLIDGNQTNTCLKVQQNTLNVNIRGFSLTNAWKNGGGGGLVLSPNSTSTITNCYIFNNKAVNGAGIQLFGCSSFFSGLVVNDNYALEYGGGLYTGNITGTSYSIAFDPINRCSIFNNTAGIGQDIVMTELDSNINIPLHRFSIEEMTPYYACVATNNGNNYTMNIDILNAHHQEINSDLYVSPTGDDANDGLSPATALKTIHTAVYKIASDSLNQRTVHLLPGTYSRTANQQMFPIALKSWVKVQGEGIEQTQIVGEPDNIFSNQALKVFTSFYQSHISLVDISISSENTDNSCALWGEQEDNLHLKNVRMNNLSPNTYAVIDVTFAPDMLWDGVRIEDFSTARMGFLHSDGYITGTIRNCTFRNAVSTYMSSEVGAYPLFWANLGSNLTIENAYFSNITMMDNDSQAIAFGYSYPTGAIPRYMVNNCLFSDIICNERAVLIQGNDVSVTNISNCTFAGHTGNGEALMVNGNVTINNCIFYNERSVEIAINPMDGTGIPTTLTLNNNLIRNGYSDIWQGPGSTINYADNNITGNPLFLGGDDIHDPQYYSLSASSPCIDAGTQDTTGLSLLPYDLAGNMRIWNNVIDMGCYEFGAPPVDNDDPVVPQISGAIYASNYPNPFNPETNISFFLPEAGNTELCIYNLKGQVVRRLISSPLGVGTHRVLWDGKDECNSPVASGMYLYLVQCGKHQFSGKMVLAK